MTDMKIQADTWNSLDCILCKHSEKCLSSSGIVFKNVLKCINIENVEMIDDT